ncbi:hypothetical protein THRCLA_22938 [Thraustotheca clavata]|uniref:DUF659 domain-containing protein n=1 Tax=Thraustotheca clavata TaxID=74557 RepID=A0A1V9YMZ0_9STRA|nr:hypothetical protein THRCLA_22938 [Thraustotheca clavata]
MEQNIATDGWTDQNGSSIINFMSTGAEKHTATNLAEQIIYVIKNKQEQTTARVIGLVIAGGCAAHVLNLLFQDVIKHPALVKIQLNAVAITRYVRDHHALWDSFKLLITEVRHSGIHRKGLVLPVPTRWYSLINCIESLYSNKDVHDVLFVALAYFDIRKRFKQTIPARTKPENVVAIISDDFFWDNLSVILRFLHPLKCFGIEKEFCF